MIDRIDRNDRNDNPYIGPRTFQEKDRHLFFGREREASDLFALVVSQRLLLFYAKSGAGKSSLINTCLVPDLREEGFDILPIGRVSGQLPAGIRQVSNIFVFNLLLHLDQNSQDPAHITQTTLSDYLQALAVETNDSIDVDHENEEERARILIIDQFEEILTSHLDHWNERENFFLQLRQAMLDDPLLWVVLALREDHVAALDPYAHFLPGKLRARFYMQRMRAAVALEAIQKPATQGGRPFAPGVAQALVDNLRQMRSSHRAETHLGEFVEPVQLQVVCYQLWENLKDRPPAEITKQDLEELGNVDQALSEFYEQALVHVLQETGGSEIELRNWFERELITEAGTRGLVYQGQKNTNGLSNQAVHLLVNQFLLRREARAGGTWYELVHDRFIAPILQANRTWRLRQSPLMQAAEAWQHSGRNEDHLYEGWRLKNTLAHVHREALEPLVKEFLSASEEAQKKRDRAKQRMQIFLAVLTVLFLLAVGTSIWAFNAQIEADARAIEAEQERGIAKAERKNAEEQRKKAEEQKDIAEQEKGKAEEQKDIAEQERQEALRQKNIAEQEKENAEKQKDIAEQERQVALRQSRIAEQEKEKAEEQKLEAQLQSRISLAQSLAAQAPRLANQSNERGLAALLAVQAYHLNNDTKGQIQYLVDSSLRETLSHPYLNTKFSGHQNGIRSLAFTPNGQCMASASDDGTIRLWDLNKSSSVVLLEPKVGLLEEEVGLSSVTIAANGKRLAAASKDGTIYLWDLSQDDCKTSNDTTLPQHKTQVNTVALSADGQLLASGDEDGMIRLWSGTSEKAFKDTGSNVTSIAFNPNGDQLTFASLDGQIRLWDLNPNSEPTLLGSHGEGVNFVAFAADGQTVASASNDNLIYLWDLKQPNRATKVLSGHQDSVLSVAFSPDGQTLASASNDQTVRLWDLTSSEPSAEPTILRGHDGGVWSVVFSSDGKTVASAGYDRRIQLWSPGVQTSVLADHESQVWSVAFSSDNKLASGDWQGKIFLWDVENLKATPTLLQGHQERVVALAFHPNKPLLASASDDGTTRLWDLATGTPQTLNRHSKRIWAVAFNHDGKKLASASNDGFIWLWDASDDDNYKLKYSTKIEAQEGETQEYLEKQKEGIFNKSIWSLAFSPDDQWLASAHEDQTIRLWNSDLSDSLDPLKKHSEGVLSVAFHPNPDDLLLASASYDGTIGLWNLNDLNPDLNPVPKILEGHRLGVWSVAFSSNGQLLASTSEDNTIRLWQVSTPDVPPIVLSGHEKTVTSVAFSPDGPRVASASLDGTVRVWPRLDKLLKSACEQVRRNLTWEEWEQYLRNEPYQATCPNWPPHPSVPEDMR